VTDDHLKEQKVSRPKISETAKHRRLVDTSR